MPKAEKRSQAERERIKAGLTGFMVDNALTKRDLFWFAHMVDYDLHLRKQEEKRNEQERIDKERGVERPARKRGRRSPRS